MSTRSVLTFIDERGRHSVYKHHDGYPSDTLDALLKTVPYAWDLPRFEADDFGAAFIAANKQRGGGSIRLTKGPEAHGDLEYDYEISFQNNAITVKQFDWNWGSSDNHRDTTPAFEGTLDEFKAHVEKAEADA